jgi:hypothetical protein
MGSFGTQTAALAATGGYTPGRPSTTTVNRRI